MKKHHANCLRIRISKISYSAPYFSPMPLNQRHSYLLKKPSSLLQSCWSLRVRINTLPAKDSMPQSGPEQAGGTCGHHLQHPGEQWWKRLRGACSGLGAGILFILRRHTEDGHTGREVPKPPHVCSTWSMLHFNPEYINNIKASSVAGFMHFIFSVPLHPFLIFIWFIFIEP